MDKSFNDQELSDIMKEIEALEEDYSPSDKASTPVMEELAKMDEADAIPVSTSNIVSLDHTHKRPELRTESTASTSMTFKIQGNLMMDLQFDIGGKLVTLEVSEAGLNIQLENGMTFTVPVCEKSSLKKAV